MPPHHRSTGMSNNISGTLPCASLTPAERLVAAMAAEGLPYKSIARELGKSPATVRNQLHAIYQKLGVGNRTALAYKLRGEPGEP
ncbi:helix-turn-helix domain-containing protein [Janthinobacterium violaceinigrum]|uniref:Helix-turn-helix domain-containing protein n=2 Tax=Janthinobacterium violaceinigrum TaxID=2654252 RepID=A0A6I1IB84_9BURK|nr:helix-turn-helix domain-containing protein [Janthinobacterium violaceinigrum]